MDSQTAIAEAIVADPTRRAEVSEDGLTVEAGEPGFLGLGGRINRDDLITVIEGALAGGPRRSPPPRHLPPARAETRARARKTVPAMKAEILSLRTLHEGWSRFSLARVRLADGSEAEREIEDHGDSVGVLPYDPARRVATLVRELRVPALYAAGEQSQLEAPAGLIDAGTPEENARREVLEETGLRLGDLDFVGATYSCDGISTERIHLYLAAYAAADRVEGGGGADGEHENIRVVEMPLADLARMAERCEFTDLKTLTLVLALRARRPELFAG